MPLRKILTLAVVLFGAMLIVSTRSLTGGKSADPAPGAPTATATASPAPAAPRPARAQPAQARASAPARPPGGSTGLARTDTPTAAAALPRMGQMYRWRDASGRIHYTSDPPPVSVRASVIPFEREEIEAAARPAGNAEIAAAPSRFPSLPDPLAVYTPEGLEDLFDQVEITAGRLLERKKELESLKEQLQQ